MDGKHLLMLGLEIFKSDVNMDSYSGLLLICFCTDQIAPLQFVQRLVLTVGLAYFFYGCW